MIPVAKPMTGTVVVPLSLDAFAAVLTLLAENVGAGTVIDGLLDDVATTTRLLVDDHRAYVAISMTEERAAECHDNALQALWLAIGDELTPTWELPAEAASKLGLQLMEAAFEAGPQLGRAAS